MGTKQSAEGASASFRNGVTADSGQNEQPSKGTSEKLSNDRSRTRPTKKDYNDSSAAVASPFSPAALLGAILATSVRRRLDDPEIRERIVEAASSAVRGDGYGGGGESPLYGTVLNALRYQRDQYLTGRSYADAQSRRREIEDRLRREFLGMPHHDEVLGFISLKVPLEIGRQTDWPSVGEAHLASLAKTYIPSQMTIDSLRPTVLWLPSRDGPLRQPLTSAVTNLIPLGQPGLDKVMVDNILWFLKDEEWRHYIKARTMGLVSGATNGPVSDDAAS